jgi:hypothetical protein
MYDLTTSTSDPQEWHRGSVLRIGSFGATRPLKNLLTAGAAALQIASRLKADLEFHVSAGRSEGGGDTIMRGLEAMYNQLPNGTIMHDGWSSWPSFRHLVRIMHLVIRPSYTESFSMVSADASPRASLSCGSEHHRLAAAAFVRLQRRRQTSPMSARDCCLSRTRSRPESRRSNGTTGAACVAHPLR